MKSFLQLAYRECRALFKNDVALAIFFLAPIAYALLLGSVYQKAKITDLPILLVDLDNTPLSHQLAEALDDNQYLKVVETQYDEEGLESAMSAGEKVAVLTFPAGFEADIFQKRHPIVNIDVNGANMVTANYATSGIMKTLGTWNAGLEIEGLKKGGMPSSIAQKQFEAFQINLQRHANPSLNYLHFLWPGMLGTIMQQVFLLVLALSFAREHDQGTMHQLNSFSRSTGLILLGKSFPYWIMGILLWGGLVAVFFPIFKVPIGGDAITWLVLTSVFMFGLTFMGVAASILLKTQLKATELLMVVATPSFIISGFTWPLSEMPVWVQKLAVIIPLTHFLEAARKLMLFDVGIKEIGNELQAMGIIGFVSLFVAYLLLHFRLNIKAEEKTPQEATLV